MEQRIIELEMRYMQQEHVIQELNETVCRQEAALEILKRDFASLKQQVMAMSPFPSSASCREEPPPHY